MKISVKLLTSALLFILITTAVPIIRAQGEQLTPIYLGDIPRGLSWSPDSQTFVFNDSGWHQYDPITEQLIETEGWPLQSALSQTELSIFEPAIGRTGSMATIYQSEGGDHILYGGEQVTNWWRLNIGNRQAGEVFTTSGRVLQPFSAGQYFDVLWSEDDTTFVVTNMSAHAFRRFTYGRNYSDDITNIMLIDFSLPNQEGFYLMEKDGAYDLSSDGSLVLVQFTEAGPELSNPYDQTRRLALWNPMNPSTTQILSLDATEIIGASFAPNDDGNILFVDTAGLWEYDLVTNTKTLINAEISASADTIEGYERAVFSPDGRWVAVTKEIEYGAWGIFVVDTDSVAMSD